jgi:Ca2+-binding RTX toxin-like protein
MSAVIVVMHKRYCRPKNALNCKELRSDKKDCVKCVTIITDTFRFVAQKHFEYPARMPLSLPFFRCVLACVAIISVTAFSVAVSPSVAAAQTAPLGTSAESAIAVPFIGSFEVWCTDRNPAPDSRCSRHHGSPAIDIGMDPGIPIYATGTGIVIDAENNCPTRGACNNGKGNNVVIGHADGTYSRYLHLGSVTVQSDESVTVGQQIGTSGESGQYSSPHLHYDEHFPFGTRTDMGAWIGCVDGAPVQYPDVFGETDWNEVPYGSIIENDGYECLEGVDVSSIRLPRLLSGSTHFAVAPPLSPARSWFELSVDMNDETGAQVTGMPGSGLLRMPTPANGAEVRVRELVDGQWQRWSSPISYTAVETDGPTCHGLHATLEGPTGTPSADVIIGTPDADQINAMGGNDIICAGAGDDSILAGPGNDLVFGGVGDDTISGGRGADKILAEAGEDVVRGGNGPDVLHGGPGDDHLHGTAGNDTVNGGNGNDTVIGGIGHDILLGGADDDRLEGRNGRDALGGGNGDDELYGGNGRDRLVGAGGTDTLTGGPGSDRCVSDAETIEIYEGCER